MNLNFFDPELLKFMMTMAFDDSGQWTTSISIDNSEKLSVVEIIFGKNEKNADVYKRQLNLIFPFYFCSSSLKNFRWEDLPGQVG